MMSVSNPLTVTNIAALAGEILEGGGFKAVDPSAVDEWRATTARVYEDRYSIVCVAVYETWSLLSARWVEDQDNLVRLISEYFARTDAKAWDGYLVLFTPSFVPANERLTAVGIQRNTRHVRKLFADGNELGSMDAVRRVLLPLLPLEEHEALQPRNLLDSLVPLLAKNGVGEEAVQLAIAAFLNQRSITAEIHGLIAKRRGEKT
jgi:hypothetical protein